jgi:hypothetical protein
MGRAHWRRPLAMDQLCDHAGARREGFTRADVTHDECCAETSPPAAGPDDDGTQQERLDAGWMVVAGAAEQAVFPMSDAVPRCP